ncbi:DUF1707 and DUF4870 domain-containing protein [Nocardioides albus]|uniref:Putative Tic20 family protein n=1 Tax=Nocardioides albus TaxID=1841 RepID=A0A7W5A2X1_9ACTN|nr:DUF1707 and DUF4870 domain-containing protein [Nocardioides albus]MBB3088473.1 putative Tic20 family protein [Nocardioides albus]GGU16548.1 hypothetical protein GCM10007979_13620 [Nocardioides albus]
MSSTAPIPTPPASTTPPAQSDELRCTDADRDRVIDVLKSAYADGRLDQAEFDVRFDLTMKAKTYVALEPITRDLVAQPAAVAPSPAKPARDLLPPPTTEERLLAALAQATTWVPIVVGPAILYYTVGKRSEFVKHHAAGALNLQLTLLAVTIVTFGLGGALYGIAWVLATAFAVVALAGAPLRQPWVLPIFGRGGPYEKKQD